MGRRRSTISTGSHGKQTKARLVNLESLARSYTEVSIKRLGGYATSPNSQPMVAIRAIEILLERGWGKAPQSHQVTGATGGAIEVVIRDLLSERRGVVFNEELTINGNHQLAFNED